MMAAIRNKDTAPEVMVRSALHRRGFRFRVHVAALPGTPDIVFSARRAVIVIHGCFWHGHGCHIFKWPSTRRRFWRNKIEGTRQRDATATIALHKAGWRILTIWECAFKGRFRHRETDVMEIVARWVAIGREDLELQGNNYGSAR